MARCRRNSGLLCTRQAYACGGGHPLSGFKQVLEQIRRESKTTAELGRRFELLMLQFFKKDSDYAAQFKEVIMWREYSPDIDTGIDLVATDYHGEKWAIQCKGWKDDSIIGYGDLRTTFTEGSVRNIKPENIIIVIAGDKVSSTLVKKCEALGTHIISRSRLENSLIDWDANPKKIKTRGPYRLMDHQKIALRKCLNGFKKYNRGRCIMACGTGKTLTAQHIAEKQARRGGSVLYLVPSISLVRQTKHAWAANHMIPHNYLTICSDKTVGKEDVSTTSLSGVVTTDTATIRKHFKKMLKRTDALHVVFSTYQSSDKVRDAFTGHEFDLIVFDEAHRTASAVKNEDTNFTLAHHDRNIRSKKRLYMTATPRIHKESVKIRAKESDHTLYSMEDKKTFGELFYRLKFSEAVDLGVLADYRVVAFEISKKEMADFEATHGDEADITLEESTKLSSVYHAIMSQDNGKTHNLLQRIIVFCNSIKASKDFSIGRFAPKSTKKGRSDGTMSQGRFKEIVERENRNRHANVRVYTDHVDGTYSSGDRDEQLDWLKEDLGEDECRILSNAQCLSEGVDVPALDGVVFYEPRSSMIDVVQAVGRVMRRKGDKEFGYVIVPVVTTAEGDMETASQTNKAYKTQMQVLDALRDHDDRINRFFNQMQLAREQQRQPDIEKESVVVPPPLAEVSRPLKALIMKKVGGFYFEDYGRRLGEVAADIELKIRSRVEKPDRRDAKYVDVIDNLYANLVGTVGETVTRRDTIKALAQHITIKPVFDQLFKTNFSNPVSKAFDAAVAGLRFREETEPLEEYYNEMEYQIKNITDERMRQGVIKRIYDNFFEGFDENTAAEYGIVYTPPDVVDYIIHSIQHVLKTEFGVGFNDASVRVLDPFAGTGVFIARLMQSGLLGSNIYDKYKKDLHMNELLLLAYYVATVNIETTYYKIKRRHVPYNNGCYVDTFTLDPEYLKRKQTGDYVEPDETKLDRAFKPVLDRVKMQRGRDITVIMGNPPWNVNKATTHKKVEKRIGDTYGIHTTVKNSKSQKNSYIKAIRYASDRIGDSGVIGFVLPASWLRGNTEAGLRAVLYKEFTDIWVFDMRGNQQGTKGDESRREGGKIFGGKSRQPTTMLILVKKPSKHGKCEIHYHDIGDGLSREEKLETIQSLKSIKSTNWQPKIPNEDHDWLNQRNPYIKQDYYKKCMPMGNNDAESEPTIFTKFSQGITTGRDPWVYNTSYNDLVDNMKRTIKHCAGIDLENPDTNPKYVHWGGKNKEKSALKAALKKILPEKPMFDETNICLAQFRPFIKQYLYFDKGVFISRPREHHKFFPVRNITETNYAITVDPTQPNPTQPNPTQPNPTQPYYAVARQAVQDSSSQYTHQIYRQSTTGKHSRTGGHERGYSGAEQDIGVHDIHIEPTTRLGGDTSQPNVPIQEGMNMAIIVPDKVKNDLSVFISNLPPDLHILATSKTFPLGVLK